MKLHPIAKLQLEYEYRRHIANEPKREATRDHIQQLKREGKICKKKYS